MGATWLRVVYPMLSVVCDLPTRGGRDRWTLHGNNALTGTANRTPTLLASRYIYIHNIYICAMHIFLHASPSYTIDRKYMIFHSVDKFHFDHLVILFTISYNKD